MKMNMNMIVGKRQIILAALVLGLGVAVYLNWEYAKLDGDLALTSKLETTKSYGDAQYVDSTGVEDEAYFAEAKLSRTRSRDEAVETLKEILGDTTLETSQKAELAMKAAELADSIEVEGKIENLIKSKGFADCMVYYDTERVDVIVKAENLDESQVMQMRDIIVRETSVPLENISIVEVN